MKKFFYYLFVFTLLFQVAVSFSACGDDPMDIGGNNDLPDISGKDSTEVPGKDSTNVDVQVYKDKEDFEKIAIEMMDEFKASDFKNVLDLAEYIVNEYSEYETDEAEEWFEECTGEVTVENKEDYYITAYKLSNFKGRFVAEDGRWKRYDSNNLSINVKDQNNRNCEAVLTTSGNTKKVLLEETESVEEGWKEEIWVHVPQNIEVVLKQGGKELAKVVINTDLSSMSGSSFNLAKDKYNVNASVYFNGYTYSIDKLYYQDNKESYVNISFKHGDKALFTAQMSVTPNVGDFTFIGDEFDEDELYDNSNLKNNSININILDKLEVKGACSDLKKLLEVFEDEEDEHLDSKINRYVDMNLYFYGSKESTAVIEAENYKEYCDYCDEYHYYLAPVIVFNDGSRHSFENFFNEEDFKNTINIFGTLFEQFEDLIYGYDFDL